MGMWVGSLCSAHDRYQKWARLRQGASMDVPEEILDELVRRLVEAVHPKRIILFGSTARGGIRAHSDLDVLVVVSDSLPQKEGWSRAYAGLRRFGLRLESCGKCRQIFLAV